MRVLTWWERAYSHGLFAVPRNRILVAPCALLLATLVGFAIVGPSQLASVRRELH